MAVLANFTMRLVLSHVALITVIGLLVGAGASLGLGRFINALLFDLVATDLTIAIAGVTLGMAAALAGYLPARRAARVDPRLALRQD